MNLYRVVNAATNATVCWYGTREDAHEEHRASGRHTEVRIESVSINNDKEALLLILNGAEHLPCSVLRTWIITKRGGLKEVANGE